ncbi:MAG: T9SS type A sorting domain-containing protein [Ignavibacteria bacterium]|nr:T9SS type A sorting domain-containing protein [Ignavibacteria bacterium]
MKFTTLFLLLLLLAAASSSAQEVSGSIRLPNEGYTASYERLIRTAQADNASSARWQAFLETHGSWQALWNEYTHTPYRVWGEGTQIPGYRRIDSANADAAARGFIATMGDLLRCDGVELALTDVNEYEGKWTVTYEQRFKGVPVLTSEVTVSMTTGGRVFLFGADVFPQLEVPVAPVISPDDAKAFAATGLVLPVGAAAATVDGQLSILPYKSLAGVTHHLVYDVTLPQDEFHIWNTLVDARTGAVLRRANQILDGIYGTVNSSVKNVSYAVPATNVAASTMYVKVNGANVTTDASGAYTSTNSGTVTVKFEGPYCKIARKDGADAVITQTIANNQTYNITWSNSNSVPAERDAFWAVNRSRDYIIGLDNGVTALNYQVLTNVNMSSTCNANFDGTNLNFYRGGTSSQGVCPNAAEMVDVVMHEYGHLTNAKCYVQFGKSNGMTNGALNEGTADGFAALLLDRPEMGVGFFGTGTVLRNLNNTRRYPDDIINEVHYDGEIMGGILWDLRQNIGLSLAQHHSHYTRRGKPDDANTGKAYTKYFLEVLKVDDNDGNLTNGTPNATGIVAAFAKHGIPAGMLTLTHTKVSSAAPNTTIPVTITVASPMTEISVPQVRVYYRPTGGQWSSSAMTKTSGQNNGTSQWSGNIPGQAAGTLLQYYIEATETWGSTAFSPVAGDAQPYLVLVGFTSYTKFDFESAMGWQGHIGSDDAMTGRFILADPVGTLVSSMYVQPEDDHSPTGTKCWVTGNGAASGGAGDNDVDDGVTSVWSPALGIASLNIPVIRYWSWFSNDLGAAPGGDPWVVQISSDNGSTWVNVENTTSSFNYWNENVIVVSDYVTPTNTVKLKFTARDDDPQSLVEAALDDVEILYVQNIPVEFASMSAARKGDAVTVEWRTAMETNNQGFEVQYRLAADADWRVAGFVAAKGGTLAERRYAFSFDESTGGEVTVRLRQLDTDGTQSYSPEVLVSGRALQFALGRNYPNPANGSTVVPFELASGSGVTVVLRNMLGAEVLRMDAGALPAGAHAVRLETGRVPSGMYTCHLEAGGAVLTQRILIQR